MMEKKKHASFFSGIEGFGLAAEWVGWETVLTCETGKFQNKLLKQRFPKAKQYENIKDFDGREWRDKIHLVTGGFPCQPFSHAGSRNGADDDRYLWPEMCRVVDEIRPTWFIGENVDGILSMVQPGETIAMGGQTDLFGESKTVFEEGFWATPNTMDHLPARDADSCSTNQKNRKGRSCSGNLREQVVHPKMFPTPTASDKQGTTGGNMRSSLRTYTRLYPTPLASEANYRLNGNSQQSMCLSGIVRRKAIEKGEAVGQLNPDWEEWLMGYPVGWTDPDKKRVKREYRGDEYPSVEPKKLPRITNKKKNRFSRIESIGNAIQPQVAFEIFKIIDLIDNLNQPYTCANPENQHYLQ